MNKTSKFKQIKNANRLIFNYFLFNGYKDSLDEFQKSINVENDIEQILNSTKEKSNENETSMKDRRYSFNQNVFLAKRRKMSFEQRRKSSIGKVPQILPQNEKLMKIINHKKGISI